MLYYLSIGANLGDRENTIRQAVEQIEQHIGHVRSCSSFYYSAPWGFASVNEFCNICCALVSDRNPLEVLRLTQAVESALGRTHKSRNGVYSDRMIDIDLIRAFDAEGNEIRCNIADDRDPTGATALLTLPHPLWTQRDFVTVPLAEITDTEGADCRV